MKPSTCLASVLAIALFTVSASGLAQHGPQQRPGADRPRPSQTEQAYDRDRMQGRDRVDQQERQKAQDEVKTMAQARQSDRDIYGYQLMTEQERLEYRQQFEKAKTNEERQQIIAEHREKMQARAKEQGLDLEETEESE